MPVQKFFALAVLLVIIVAPLAHAGPQREYLDARTNFYTLLKSNSKQQYRHNWDKVLNPLHNFVKTHPEHNKTPAAYYLLGKAYTRLYEVSHLRSDLDMAVSMFAELEQRFARSSLADDALYHSAELLHKRYGDSTRASSLCQKLLQRYPDGDMCSKAEHLLEQCGYSSGAQGTEVVLTDLRYSVNPERARVVVETTEPVAYTDKTLTQPARLFLDVAGLKPPQQMPNEYSVKRGNSVLRSIRMGEHGENTRIVCDLSHNADYHIFTLDNPARIVVDISNKAAQELKSLNKELHAPERATQDHVGTLVAQNAAQRVNMVALPPKKTPHRRLCVVVDPGHGGKDPGAVGPNNLYEKDITLAISKKLARILKDELDCDVHMTRTEDVYLTLRQRTAFANQVKADVFISIHANASVNKSVRGTETFFLNFSKSAKAVEVAARENDMSLQEVGDLDLILFDLMANSKINESSRLATNVQKAIIQRLKKNFSGIKDLGVKQGPFHVLLGADMPSILVEAAFISNKREAKLLVNRKFQQHTAEGIVTGVKAYLKEQNMVAEYSNE